MTLKLTTTAKCTLEAIAADSTSAPTFRMVAYTGAPMVANYQGKPTNVVVDMQGVRTRSPKVVALWNHDENKVVGQGEMSLENGNIIVAGMITGDNEESHNIVSHARNGFQWQASIGANPQKLEAIPAGKSVVVNGKTVVGPVLISRDTPIHEVSFVPFGADANTSVVLTGADASLLQGGVNMNPFEQWLSDKGFDPSQLSESQSVALRKAYDADSPASPKSLEAILGEAKRENDRQEEIARISAGLISQYPHHVEVIGDLAKAAITAKMAPNDFELNCHRNLKVPGSAVSNRHNGSKTLSGAVLEAALCQHGKLPDIEKHFSGETLEAADRSFRNGLTLQELFLGYARRNDPTVSSGRDVRNLLKAAFQTSLRAEGFSTVPLSGILSNVANKFLLQGFMAVETAWREVCTIRSVSDFKTVTSYRLTGDFSYKKVGPTGELKFGTLGEESYTNRAETYGLMMGIPRTDIINDDLGALTSVPMRLGRGAATRLNTVFWTEFLADVTTFFTTGRGNYFEGSTTNLQSSSLKTAVEKFRKQTDADGLPLAIQPAILLVGPENEVAADELYTSTNLNTGGSSTTDKVMNSNVFARKYRPVVSSYLSNSSITNYSTTHWFLLANPMDLSAIEVAFLNGKEAPTVETAEADFNTLGVQMRGYHDFGVSKQDYRAAVRSKGAA
ncbi:MAG: hypothetical protein EBR82_24230 [Caulobacteraceae bacterium]|nr:hypothetical protein [Caulobacteraceae bacterium]